MMKKFLLALLCAAASFSLPCAANAGERTISVGASPTPHAEILAEAAKIMGADGYKLKIIEYSDYVQPNVALESGDLDANYFQHKPYLDDFNAQKGAGLASMGPVHYEPFAIYGGHAKDLKKLARGSIVAVPNDATNEGRALLLLQDKGLIKLKPDAGLTTTRQDIVENPLGLKIEEIEAPQLVRSLPDVDIAVINGNYAILGGLKVADALAVESPDSMAATTYANVLAVEAGRESDQGLQALYRVLTSPEVAKFMRDRYAGAVLPSRHK